MNPCHCMLHIYLTSVGKRHLRSAPLFETSYKNFSNFTRNRSILLFCFSIDRGYCERKTALIVGLASVTLLHWNPSGGIYNLQVLQGEYIPNVICFGKSANGLALTRGQRPLSRTVMYLLGDTIWAMFGFFSVGTKV
jgi:hypothetical protein